MAAKLSDVVYDVIVVGGGPMGLSAAYQCTAKENKTVIVIEKYTFGNAYGSSPGFGRQFRTCYSERNLCELAIETSPLWDELMEELNDKSLLRRTGVLWFGDGTVETGEGNIDKAVENLRDLQQKYTLLEGKEDILKDERFSFVSQAVNDIDKPKALYLDDGGTINVPALIRSLVKKLKEKETGLLEKANVECIDYSSQDVLKLSVVSDQKQQLIYGKKVIMTPGADVNCLLSTLRPAFTKRINLLIYLWGSTYFKSKKTVDQMPGTQSDSCEWPVWIFFGQPDDSSTEKGQDLHVFYGFPNEKMKACYARVAPAFTSSQIFDFELYAPSIENRPLDLNALHFTSAFVEKSMPSLSPTLLEDEFATCLSGFAVLVSGSKTEDDQSAGFVLDFLPGEGINNRLVLYTGGWGMKFVPVIGKILADLTIRGRTDYSKLIEPMNINRGILLEDKDISQTKSGQKQVGLTIS